MEKKGFTLVELIITISIMGVLLLVAFPSVTRLTRNNKYKKVASYGQSMIAASKLYVDQYAEDLWGSLTATGTRSLSMQTLVGEDLLKKYVDKKDNCSVGSVQINRTGSRNNFNYTYTFSLTCTVSKKVVVCSGDSNTSRCIEDGREVYNSVS